MPKFVIEREIPGAGKLTDQQVQAISKKSCAVLASMKGAVQWQHSYVTDDKLSKQGDFPANKIARVSRVIDPTTAE